MRDQITTRVCFQVARREISRTVVYRPGGEQNARTVMNSPRVDLKIYEVGGGCTRCPLPKLMLNLRAQRKHQRFGGAKSAASRLGRLSYVIHPSSFRLHPCLFNLRQRFLR